MPRRSALFSAVAVIGALLTVTPSAIARGGGGRGPGNAGGGGFRGGAMNGSGGSRVVAPGYRGAGYSAYGPGYYGFNGRPYGGYYGWGSPYGYYGWGYPYYGYGLGLGLGLGLGYGISSGYGYSGYGYGYPGYAYGSPVYPTTAVTYTDGNSNNANTTLTAGATPVAVPQVDAAMVVKAREFVERGDAAFKKARYDEAAYAYRHATVDDPQNSKVLLKLAQSLFAIGKYDEAAAATQAAMRQLPDAEWGFVVTHYQEFYGKAEDYTHQLHALERALGQKSGDPAMRFLVAYHYGYLGFLKQSVEQLDKVVQNEPRDEMAKQLRDEMKRKLGVTEGRLEIPPSPLPPVPSPDI